MHNVACCVRAVMCAGARAGASDFHPSELGALLRNWLAAGGGVQGLSCGGHSTLTPKNIAVQCPCIIKFALCLQCTVV